MISDKLKLNLFLDKNQRMHSSQWQGLWCASHVSSGPSARGEDGFLQGVKSTRTGTKPVKCATCNTAQNMMREQIDKDCFRSKRLMIWLRRLLDVHGKAWSLAALPSEDYLSYRGAQQEPCLKLWTVCLGTLKGYLWLSVWLVMISVLNLQTSNRFINFVFVCHLILQNVHGWRWRCQRCNHWNTSRCVNCSSLCILALLLLFLYSARVLTRYFARHPDGSNRFTFGFAAKPSYILGSHQSSWHHMDLCGPGDSACCWGVSRLATFVHLCMARRALSLCDGTG